MPPMNFLGAMGAGGVEFLEARIAPATFVVTSLADDGSAGTLRDAVQKANASAGTDTITFAPAVAGTVALASGEIEITDSLTIKGPGAGRLAIDAGGKSRIFKIDYTGVVLLPTAISALTLLHGRSAEDGGALLSNETALLGDLVIAGSHADGDGGGAFIGTDGKGLLLRCRFVGNSAGGEGGGLSVTAGESLLLRQSVFSKNTAAGDGGGLALRVDAGAIASTVVTGCAFAGNLAGGDGGGLHVSDVSATKTVLIQGSRIAGNRAGGSGGGIAANDGQIAIDQTLIASNIARYAGGAVADHADGLTIRGSQILGNVTTSAAGIGGGGLSVGGHHAVAIVASIIAKNRSASIGGGISLADEVTVSLASSAVTGNAAARSGVNIHTAHGTKLRS